MTSSKQSKIRQSVKHIFDEDIDNSGLVYYAFVSAGFSGSLSPRNARTRRRSFDKEREKATRILRQARPK